MAPEKSGSGSPVPTEFCCRRLQFDYQFLWRMCTISPEVTRHARSPPLPPEGKSLEIQSGDCLVPLSQPQSVLKTPLPKAVVFLEMRTFTCLLSFTNKHTAMLPTARKKNDSNILIKTDFFANEIYQHCVPVRWCNRILLILNQRKHQPWGQQLSNRPTQRLTRWRSEPQKKQTSYLVAVLLL